VPQAVIAIATIDDTDDTCTGIRIVRLDADEFVQGELAAHADVLLAYLDAGELCEPESAAALDDVKVVNAEADPDAETVDVSDLVDDIARLHELKAAVKAVTDEQKLLEARIRDAIGHATTGTAEGWRVSISQPAATLTAEAEQAIIAERPDLAKAVLDRDKAKAEAPELYESHRQPVGARRLTIKQTEGDNR
jgi:predicted phage-related endonuclease